MFADVALGKQLYRLNLIKTFMFFPEFSADTVLQQYCIIFYIKHKIIA